MDACIRHFDGQYLYIRVVSPVCYNRNTYKSCDTAYFQEGATRVCSYPPILFLPSLGRNDYITVLIILAW
jgi:hypothetical protein